MFRKFGLYSPVEFYTVTRQLFVTASRKYPRASVVLPVVGCTSLGFILMETTTPKPAYTGDNETMAEEIFGNKRQENFEEKHHVDPYDLTAAEAREEKKKEAMGTEQRKVYEMLTSLRSKSREQKLNDAFAAMDNFMKPPKNN